MHTAQCGVLCQLCLHRKHFSQKSSDQGSIEIILILFLNCFRESGSLEMPP